MKKVFQIKLKNITRVMAMVIVTSLVTFTGCKNYDDDIAGLTTKVDQVISDVATLKTTVAALQTSVNGMTYIKSITMGTDGKLTITPSTGSAIVYDAKTYVTYDITLTGNNLMVNGVNKGTVAIPALTFGADNKLMSGTTVVADLSSWVRSLTLGADNYLYINGVKSAIMIPAATVQSVDVKGITLTGNVLTITKNDNSTSTITLPATAIVPTTGANGNLFINGVDTGVKVVDTFAVNAAGFLTVNGVATTVKIPTENKSTILFVKDPVTGILSATVTDATGATTTVKINPSSELLSAMAFVPAWIDGGLGTVEVGYMLNVDPSPIVIEKTLFNQQNVTFRFNPTSADVSKTNWAFVKRSAKVTNGMAAPGDVNDFFLPTTNVSNGDGSGVFTLKVNKDKWVDPVSPATHNLFALQAKGTDFYANKPTEVVSDFVKILPIQYIPYISKSVPSAAIFVDYPSVKPSISDMTGVYDLNYDGGSTPPSVDLSTLVLATANKISEGPALRKTFVALGFGAVNSEYEFKFDITDPYLGVDGVTNQNSSLFVSLTGNILQVAQGFASLDRTPLVRVRLYTKAATQKLLATAYMKFNITGQRSVTYNVPAVTYSYEKLFKHTSPVIGGIDATLDKTAISIDWASVNTEIYNKMAISHNDFRVIFPDALLQGATSIDVKFWNPAGVQTSLTTTQVSDVATQLVSSLGAVDVDTRKITYNITPKAKFGKYEITYTFIPAANDKTLKLVYTFTVGAPVVDRSILPQYYYLGVNNNKAFTEGVAESSVYVMKAYIGEFFGFGTNNSSAYRKLFSPAIPGTSINWIDGVSHKAEIITDPTLVTSGASTTGAALTNLVNTLDGVYGTTTLPKSGADIKLTTPLTTDFRFYNVKLTEYNLPNGETLSHVFDVYFVNPLTFEAKANPIVMINKTNGTAYTTDLKLNYIVKFKGRNIITYGVNEPLVPTPTYLYYPASEYGVDASQLTYTVAPVIPYTPTILSLTGSILKWDNAGGGISTNPLSVGTTSVKIATSFAERTLTVPVQVVPE